MLFCNIISVDEKVWNYGLCNDSCYASGRAVSYVESHDNLAPFLLLRPTDADMEATDKKDVAHDDQEKLKLKEEDSSKVEKDSDSKKSDDFEIKKKEDTVQKKRKYRSNKESDEEYDKVRLFCSRDGVVS